jgi:ubiquinone/menaquinone biosynthesis C-methylase UbiE
VGYPGWAYDLLMRPLDLLGLRAARRRLVRGLRGRVLELGTGTGLNLAVSESGAAPTVAVDRELRMLQTARHRAGRTLFVCADAHALPFRDGAFSIVVESLVFCSLERPREVLGELRRVLERGGELRMVDHVRAPGRLLGSLQDALAPAWLRLTGECHLDRDVAALLGEGGWTLLRRVSRARGVLEEIEARP